MFAFAVSVDSQKSSQSLFWLNSNLKLEVLSLRVATAWLGSPAGARADFLSGPKPATYM